MLRACVRLPTATRRSPARRPPPRLAMSTSPAAPPPSSSPTPRRKQPLVAVIGTTGVGKTDLGVELALALSSPGTLSPSPRPPRRAEVINHDSMQCYRGLDVITNKATQDEMRGVEHHLMGFLEPGREWGVNDFVRDALDKIDELEGRETLPIAVGGTSYYLQNLVFPGQLVNDVTSSRPCSPDPTPSRPATPPPLAEPRTLADHVDPASAKRWHWRDVRKVSRAIEIVWTKRTWDDVRREQRARPSEGPRFRTLIFWLHADTDALHPRLDARVDKMLEEFAPYLSLARSSAPCSSSPSSSPTAPAPAPGPGPDASPELRAEFDRAVRTMKTSTRQYAKRQVKWIRAKLLPAVRDEAERARDEGREAEVVVVLLDATDLSKWRDNVRDPAVDLLYKFLDGAPLPDPASLSPAATAHLAPPSSASASSHAKRACPTCTRDPARPFLVEERQWDAHLGSKTHRVAARRRVQRGGREGARRDGGEGEEGEGEGEEEGAREGVRAASGSEEARAQVYGDVDLRR
ncbi:uncharacterized protein RHOBADRAFT_25555 [Rhodotorula graminis WP1]|uniref:tRNA dimethylallyltransferase n=1 Tax=Rhodotorula graminis (strain WP1) TaxID=578459 RepID=A0A194S7L7_RHOGW|nr:uncharacterized protein RHOBADRAFT_25555 [Rhodotorula graminis WP1]KPV76485.1 hypothetical protein RHOBADRAFT_25555 [Rhodotorula graminis WP1]